MLPWTAPDTPEVQNQEVEQAVLELAGAIEAKDRSTSEHLLRVADLCEEIARHMGLPENEIREARLAGVLHDLGKLWIEDRVLKKEDCLTEEEWEHMKEHPLLGWRPLARFECLRRVTEGLLLHHERPDGRGYPFGLRGEQIPRIARIVAVADAYDAMTSSRPYRKALSAAYAVEEIVRCRGTQFCEKVVDGFLRAFKIEGMAISREEGT